MSEFKDISVIENRAKDLAEWLQIQAPECFTEQKHLDEGTRERLYWHYGYMVALRDVYAYLTGQRITSRACSQRTDKNKSVPLA